MNIYHMPWTEEIISSRANVPTMLHPSEQRLLHWLGREFYKGRGAIVDAGCFAGGSTAALGWGLATNPNARIGCIHSFDRFHIDSEMRQDTDLMKLLNGAETDEQFLQQWHLNTAGLEKYVTLHAGDINNQSWSGEEIEICFLDVLKTFDIFDWSLRQLFPSLRPGSVVVHQDFYDPWSWFIPLQMAHLSDSFDRVASLEWVDEVFVQTSAIAPEKFTADLRALPLEAALEMMRTLHAGRNRLQRASILAQSVSMALYWRVPDRQRAILLLRELESYADLPRINWLVSELRRMTTL